MKLKDYIKKVLEQSEEGDVHFEINLNADTTVSDTETGNKITFTVHKSLQN